MLEYEVVCNRCGIIGIHDELEVANAHARQHEAKTKNVGHVCRITGGEAPETAPSTDTCAICGEPILPGSGRFRFGGEQLHPKCYEDSNTQFPPIPGPGQE